MGLFSIISFESGSIWSVIYSGSIECPGYEYGANNEDEGHKNGESLARDPFPATYF